MKSDTITGFTYELRRLSNLISSNRKHEILGSQILMHPLPDKAIREKIQKILDKEGLGSLQGHVKDIAIRIITQNLMRKQ